MANTPNVQAPIWAAAESSPWLMSAKRARIFDAFCARSIIETRADTAPPGSCADGARFLVSGLGGAATGLWATHEDQLAIAVGVNASNGWYFSPVAVEGVELYVRDENILIRNTGAAWVNIGSGVFRFQDLLDVTTAGLADGALFVWDASNGVLFPQTISNLTATILLSYLQASLDTDATLAANSDTRVASQKATKTYVDNAVTSVLHLRGSTDCSGNPNYPVAVKGDAYVVTVAGKIGGASGSTVAIGDIYFATADNAGGTQAGVGASWDILVHASVAAGGGLLAANNLSDLANAATSRTNLGATTTGANLFTVANPGAITFLRVNADNSVSLLSASAFRTAIGAGTLSTVTESIVIAASDETTALTTGDKVTFRMPYAFTLTSVKCSLTTAQTSGSIFTVDVKKGGSTIFSTKPTLDNTEKTTATAATPSVLSTTALADDDEIVININQIGDGTAKGLKVVLIGHQ